jgi:thiosulfate/3-mercaptopyruvate sulfurtransferase
MRPNGEGGGSGKRGIGKWGALLSMLALLPGLGCSRAARPVATPPASGEHAGHAMGRPAASAADAPHHDEAGERVRHNRHFLVSAAWLRDHLDSNVVVIHVGRTDSLYLAGHLPRARFLPVERVAATINGVPAEFPPVERMAAFLSTLVIRDTDRIVVYGDDPGLFAARLWVALDIMGHGERAALLDGGLTAWRAIGGAVEAGPIALPMIYLPFAPRPRPDRIVTAEWVRQNLGNRAVLFVDARPADQYAGAEPPCPASNPGCFQIPDQRRGHIPGARSLFWMNALVSRDNPVLKPMHALHHELWEPLGADQPEVRTVVTYCRTGFQSSHAYFLARYIGYPDVRMYDGSFTEWQGLDAARHPVAR